MCDIKLAMLLGVEILTIQPTIWSTRRSFDEHVFGLLKWAVLLSGNSFQEKLAPLSKISHLIIRKVRIVREGVAVCCSVLQCVVVCCSVLQCVVVCCSVLQCVAECCSVLQWVAVCSSVLQCVV